MLRLGVGGLQAQGFVVGGPGARAVILPESDAADLHPRLGRRAGVVGKRPPVLGLGFRVSLQVGEDAPAAEPGLGIPRGDSEDSVEVVEGS